MPPLRVTVRLGGGGGPGEQLLVPVREGQTVGQLLEAVRARAPPGADDGLDQLRADAAGAPGALLHPEDEAAAVLRDGDVLHAGPAPARPRREPPGTAREATPRRRLRAKQEPPGEAGVKREPLSPKTSPSKRARVAHGVIDLECSAAGELPAAPAAAGPEPGAAEGLIAFRVRTLAPGLEDFQVAVSRGATLAELHAAVAERLGPVAPPHSTVRLYTARHPLPRGAQQDAAPAAQLLPAGGGPAAPPTLYAQAVSGGGAGEEGGQPPEAGRGSSGSEPPCPELALCRAWQPAGSPQSEAGMSCFLASLLVLGKHMATEHVLRRRVLGHFRAACRFPPAVAALGAVLGGRHRQLQEADKGALACAAFKVFRAAAPAEVGDGRVFEQSRILFSMLVGHSASGDGEGELWRSVRLPAGGAEAEDEEEEEENAWLDAEERGAAAESGAGCEEVVGSAWLARRAPWLRAAWPNCDEVSLWVGPAGEPAAGAHARSCRYPWTTLRSECGKDDAVPLKLVATLSLMHAAPPCLTRGAGGRVVVFRGMPPCSVGEVLLFDPLTGEERGVDPHKHAQELGRLPGCEDEENVDARGGLPAKEAVIVCLDTSKSMCQDTGFPEEGDEAAQEDHQGPSVEENGWDETPPEDDSPTALLEALRRLSAHPNLEDFRCALKAETTAGGQETLALVLLQEVLRVEGIKGRQGWGQNAIRLCSHRRDAFVDVLLGRGRGSAPSAGLDANGLEVPGHLRCPITLDVMQDPVVADDGFTYEREVIVEWFQRCGVHPSSPMTGLPLGSADVRPNNNLRSQMAEWPGRAASRGEQQTRLREGRFQVFCVGPSTNRTVTLDAWAGVTLSDIKAQISQKFAIPAYMQLLKQGNGRRLPDNCDLVERGLLSEGSTLHVSVDMRSDRMAVKIVVRGGPHINIFAPTGATMESVLFRLWVHRRQASWLRPSKSTLWHGLEDAGDGFRCGNPLKLTSRLSEYADYGSNQSDTTPQVNLEHLTRYVGNSKQVSMTRLHCVKELFGTFVNRMQAYDFQADVGLVLFSTSASMVCKPTLITENFRDRVNQAEASGHTALYDAVDLAASALEEWRAAWRAVPGRAGNPALRVIVLSDGQDTKSRTVPWKLARRLQQADILLDAVHVGSNDMDDSLHAIAKSTGGYVFKPASVQEALRLHELEVVLHSPERPPLARRPPPITRAVDLRKFFAARYPADRADESAVPARRQPAQLEAPFVSLESAVRLLAAAGAGADAAGQAPEQPRQGGAARQRRLLREMRALMRAPHPNFDVYPCETDLGFWRLVLAMDQGADVFTPYAGGCWLMYVSFPEEYPERPPEVRFVTPICHTNTNAHGKICHSILGRNYTTDTPVSSILGSVYALVLTPDTEDAVDTALAFQSHEDPDGYRRKIAEHVQQNATARSRAEWRCQLEDSRNT